MKESKYANAGRVPRTDPMGVSGVLVTPRGVLTWGLGLPTPEPVSHRLRAYLGNISFQVHPVLCTQENPSKKKGKYPLETRARGREGTQKQLRGSEEPRVGCHQAA